MLHLGKSKRHGCQRRPEEHRAYFRFLEERLENPDSSQARDTRSELYTAQKFWADACEKQRRVERTNANTTFTGTLKQLRKLQNPRPCEKSTYSRLNR